jgi:hypothetical protein
MQGRDLRKLAFVAQICAVEFVLPSWIDLVLGAWFFPLLVLAFCGRRWTLIYWAITLVIALPQLAANLLFQGNLLGLQLQLIQQQAQQPPQPPPSDWLTPYYQAIGSWLLALPWEIRAFLLLAFLAGFAGFYALLIWWFYLGTWRRVKRIRRRVPRNLWA